MDLFDQYMWTIHILSGEVMLMTSVFLFCTVRFNIEGCTGCAACTLNCPTTTLDAQDKGTLRLLNYAHYQCVCCGECVNICPEDSVQLRHEIGLRRLFQVGSRAERNVELEKCEICGAPFAPIPQIER
ncbi:MAG: hypothetical protein JRH15_23575, partial [Deltaproteobacteria bacterium]|nr:hypothetical protein [Deltaproteobacteria bacterium]